MIRETVYKRAVILATTPLVDSAATPHRLFNRFDRCTFLHTHSLFQIIVIAHLFYIFNHSYLKYYFRYAKL
jgi:hypothetical protein